MQVARLIQVSRVFTQVLALSNPAAPQAPSLIHTVVVHICVMQQCNKQNMLQFDTVSQTVTCK